MHHLYLDLYASHVQCRTGQGACPDTDNNAGPCTDDVFNISGTKEDGVQCVTYSRPFVTSESSTNLWPDTNVFCIYTMLKKNIMPADQTVEADCMTQVARYT